MDLDGEDGRSGSRDSNTFRVVVRPTKAVNLQVVHELLRGNRSMAADASEGLSKLFLPVFYITSTVGFAD